MRKLIKNKPLIASGCALAVVFLLSCIFPWLVRNSKERNIDEVLSISKRVELFASWQSEDPTIAVSRITELTKSQQSFCNDKIEELKNLGDGDISIESELRSGEICMEITGGTGSLRICRYWVMSTGDWQNWLDFCFDMDTGMLYSYHLSSACFKSSSSYSGAFSKAPDRESISNLLQETENMELASYNEEGDDSSLACYIKDGEDIYYLISTEYLENVTFKIDITCTEF